MVRSPEVGRPLTSAQLANLTVRGLVQHLTEAFHHLLALNVSSAMGLRVEPVRPQPCSGHHVGAAHCGSCGHANMVWRRQCVPGLVQLQPPGGRCACHCAAPTAEAGGGEQVLTHWACAKISASGEAADEALLAALDDRLHGQPAIRSCPGAAAAPLPACLRASMMQWLA